MTQIHLNIVTQYSNMCQDCSGTIDGMPCKCGVVNPQTGQTQKCNFSYGACSVCGHREKPKSDNAYKYARRVA